ncbi:MAG: tRNA uridine-5-carboxymethylaminomethyl(34) synthesis GTPase MnmE [Sphingobacteriales bacterium 17-39-43]|uniref:tRNA uridine-5-carboxymethylaminomethyl(34) synthesis GTPase MnmE n=1 Tax=Daejeonella sp. TaxID=2805397 RepID=UPI000BCCAE42|nr:tRNA uridine-5-carboxymethylaminomethyl(34) synthesis GTPase MnmE [Daejeonella sp.]OYZ31150.1 MAG: tRNA uridine-5-carboxymethylaminomethyl(34) synthesis GTPase MnmE [Sphingobacteriales bacterium 16-39-50]OZA24030.1 MAG: tRNA uridine-5-carboxymethylaminomethyl(34) synthesis GTPase MnmE [Sphingobacteriales bacterium 17-39-43]HQT23194.1 tRNA uridine-5-carboxymethylaminomethyl(34) synthesis GTPase MnmE [Daejeonella sp.]HQT58145.1 tRNA uridine-5-carboxymethylaminomethyl(34) synthesis GTPase MnmE 
MTEKSVYNSDTIIALATPSGIGAIGVIRLSGPDAINLVNEVFGGKDLSIQHSHTIHFGTIKDGKQVLDEVLVSIFIGPRSYTRENVVEISTHGSAFIIESIIKLLIRKGARPANPGEFTLRAFLNGQLDLSQAEAVADLIASNSQASHQVAMQQMRGGFSSELKHLRDQLIHFASMIELELDFGEEDVEFANRDDLKGLIYQIQRILHRLIQSFEQGNVMKNGVPVVIAGKPNVGKSTLLNALLNEERAIVSEIAGTTRDTVEDHMIIGGINFRFIDTAGIRDTEDIIEAKGVERTHAKIKEAKLIVYLVDPEQNVDKIVEQVRYLDSLGIPFLTVVNKKDLANADFLERLESEVGGQKSEAGSPKSDVRSPKSEAGSMNDDDQTSDLIFISARNKEGIDLLKQEILRKVNLHSINTDDVLVSNIRHLEALQKTEESLNRVLQNIDQPITSDFLASDIKQALYYLGEITGQVTTDDLLETIFSKFCIGK